MIPVRAGTIWHRCHTVAIDPDLLNSADRVFCLRTPGSDLDRILNPEFELQFGQKCSIQRASPLASIPTAI
jgi:hypothetical protein